MIFLEKNNKNHCNKIFKRLITYAKDRLGHNKRYTIDSIKIKSELNWKPKYSFENGIKNIHMVSKYFIVEISINY